MNQRSFTLLVLLMLACNSFAQQCYQYSFVAPVSSWINGAVKEHVSGDHLWEVDHSCKCTYTAINGTNACAALSECSSLVAYTNDEGTLYKHLYYHVPGHETASGSSASNGPPVTSDTAGSTAYEGCHTPDCSVALGISGSGQGFGFTFTFPPDAVFADKHTGKLTCGSQFYKPVGGGGGGGGGGGHCCPPDACSPLIIDTTGKGFHFTDPSKSWVLFDIKGNDNPIRISWPVVGSGNGWLVIYDGHPITGGDQMFGQYTWQPDNTGDPSGFGALAEYGRQNNGGDVLVNHGQIISDKDAIWPKLRVWIDKHCVAQPFTKCVSDDADLHKLSEFGITSIGLVPQADQKTDKWGNWFRFYSFINADVNQKSKDTLKRRVYDVYVMGQGGGGAQPNACE